MVEKKITDLEIVAILEAFSKSQPIVTDRTGQSSSFRALFCFINLYVLLFIALYFLLKINQFATLDTNSLTEEFLTVLEGRVFVLFWLFVSLNMTAYFYFGFKAVCLIILVYMLNSTIDNTILFSGLKDLLDELYFLAFMITIPLCVIAVAGLMIIYKDNFETSSPLTSVAVSGKAT
ncbi:hypothetical protein OAC47_02410 [Planktomarina temperata]|nr:hypothetical protein [Planktomarina temperata]